MKKYSSQRAGKGKTAYRTPSVFRYKNIKKVEGFKIKERQLVFIKNAKGDKI